MTATAAAALPKINKADRPVLVPYSGVFVSEEQVLILAKGSFDAYRTSLVSPKYSVPDTINNFRRSR